MAKHDLRWQVALECGGQGVWEVGETSANKYHSPSWFKMRGFAPGDEAVTTHKAWLSRIHPDDLPRMLKQFEAEQTGKIDNVRHEYRERHKDGHWIWILSRGKIISRDATGRATHTIGTDTDVSEIKLNEERLAALADSEQRWRVAVESAGQGLWDINYATGQNYFSQAWRVMRGIPENEPISSAIHDWLDTVHPDDRERLVSEFHTRDGSKSNDVEHQYRQRHRNGNWVWIMCRGKIVERDSTGKTVRLIGTDTDITEFKDSESALKRLSHRYALAVSAAKVGVWEFDLLNLKPLWDENTRNLFAVSGPNELLPADIWESRLHPDDRARACATAEKAIETRGSYAMDYRIVIPSGEVRHVRCRAVYHENKVYGPKLLGVNWDVTEDYHLAEELRRAKELAERHSAEIEIAHQRMKYNALHDSLTGLPNRRQLDQILSNVSGTQPQLPGKRVALLHVDLDRFKHINDTMGHMAGDAILKRVARILKYCVGPDSTVCRAGGDEFVVLIVDAPTDEKLAALAMHLLRELNEPATYKGQECFFGASIGIAVGESGVTSGQTLLVNSDLALYRAKNEGRNRFSFFTADMQQQVVEQKKCADDILRGLDRDEFFVVYQPQFNARSLDVVGVEALVRWRHPERGILTPAAFLPVAEDINAVDRIDALVLHHALADLEQWRLADIAVPNVSVNVSARRLADSKLVESLSKLAIPRDSISFELLESIYLDNQSEVIASNLAEIRRLGIGVEIDDFGTGHASIACLHSLRPKRLKIDRLLVQPILASVELRRLLGSIVDIGKALGIEVLAEGVETCEHARILADLDCDCLQGFAFAHPMAAADLAEFVQSSRWRVAA